MCCVLIKRIQLRACIRYIRSVFFDLGDAIESKHSYYVGLDTAQKENTSYTLCN